ncbi:MAG: hypothetical protein HEQ14_10065 [Aphanizomenon flos-aquae CP01]|jgi:REP element-mobilizing transposase RayT|nr:hypothetical protein [Aphanizomenon flos-aquae UKL13-PB]MBO1061251.1 hypothetical protein [Aphanizomenon flos-aquae CP01]
MASPLRRERHSVTDLKIHLVCVTKYRRAVFTGYFAISVGGAPLEILKEYIKNQEKPS